MLMIRRRCLCNDLTFKFLNHNDDRQTKTNICYHHNHIIDDVYKCQKVFDLFSNQPLPPCDILVAADILYNDDLARQVGHRLYEAITHSSPPKVIITDSQKFHGTNFLEELKELRELNAHLKENGWEILRWETRKLKDICGSGVLVDEDQVYDVDVRMISWGWSS